MYVPLTHCRICKGGELEPVLDLGIQALTGVFPFDPQQSVTKGPLQLVKCMQSGGCGLLQLAHTYSLDEMYGLNYGYRSGLNLSMVRHLQTKVERIRQRTRLAPGDLIIDIGSNDATTLRAYGQHGYRLLGVDPTAAKFKDFYPEHVELIADFFSADLIRRRCRDQKAKVVTSFSMFYDLPDPVAFMRDVYEMLADDGIWIFEQSYMPAMLDTNSYDTVCHEHLEYYGLEQIKWMADRVGFHIADVEFNDVNGGSFSVTATKAASRPARSVASALEAERDRGMNTLEPYLGFAARVSTLRTQLRSVVSSIRQNGETIAAVGASTKGNVLLQYCGFSSADIAVVAEVNPEKFGHVTPGTHLPIAPEKDVLASNPDYLLVLPWHFRRFFEGSPAFAGRRLIFPLPEVVSVRASGQTLT